MKIRPLTTLLIPKYSTEGISLISKVNLPKIVMGKMRAILSFQDQESTSENGFIFLQDKLYNAESMN